ncbi:MAG: protein kinase, partial [Gemmatimonadales bacterium]|nr:protein kinase [Gemmatimonadales bacterium]
EIRTTARLQHPHILPLLDSGSVSLPHPERSEGSPALLYYVMPLVTGETLRARLDREQQLPVEDAVLIAREVADALGYAHELGVIHRDIKPENILLQGGHAMVADFGIALAVQSAGGQRMTQTGLSLGTPQYMSPEQAMGERTIDARSDIYALGAVTYEMLVGEAPFTGPSVQAIVARLITEVPRGMSAQRKAVPVQVEAAVMRALEKLPADRFATAGDFARALHGPGDAATLHRYLQAGAGAAAVPAQKRFSWREAAAWTLATSAVVLLVWGRLQHDPAPETPVIRTTIDPGPGERLMVGGFPIVVSAQGDRLAYVTQGSGGYRTVVRRTSELGGEVTIAAQSLRYYIFSPDGRWLAYVEGNEIRRIPSAGGASEALGSTGERKIIGLAWASPDTIIIGTDNGLMVMPARGGPPQLATDSSLAQVAAFPVVLPDGKTVLVATGSSVSGTRLVAIRLGTGQVTDVGLAGLRAFGMVHGHLVYQTSNLNLAAVPFDPKALRATGDPVPIASGVDGVGLSPSGTLAYMPDAGSTRLVLAGAGSDEVVRDEPAAYDTPRFSPDGRKIAVTIITGDGEDVWVFDRAAKTFTRMTTSGANSVPEWTPDGQRLLYKSRSLRVNGSVVMWLPVDGSAQADTLLNAGWDINEVIMSPDSRWLVVRTPPGEARHRDILAVQLDDKRTVVPIATGPASEQMPRLSPDGKWLAYQSDESGRFEIYVRPFPQTGARVQVSSDGGTEPLWDRTGRTLYYRAPNGITANAVNTAGGFSIGARRVALPGQDLAAPTHPSYDVMPDGSRFLVLRRAGSEAKAIVIHNWAREFREQLGANPK